MTTARRTIVAASVGIAGVLLMLVARGRVPTRVQSDLSDLASAVGAGLAFEARPSGGFRPPARSTRRSGESSAIELSPDARIAIARLEQRAASNPGPATADAVSVAALVAGDVDRAIASLQDLTADIDSAAAWNDLSAAYLVKAGRQPARGVEYIARALEAASRSLRLAPSDEARFNRALAVEALSPYVGALNPWKDYLANAADREWRRVAERHVSEMHPAPDARTGWERRQRELADRLARHDRTFVAEAVASFPEAAIEFFERRSMTAWAEAVQRGDTERAATALDAARELAEAVRTATGDALPLDATTVAARAGLDASLAGAHLAYAKGIAAYETDDLAGANSAWHQAVEGFRAANSPYAWWTESRLATVLFQHNAFDEADALLSRVERAARTGGSYRTLLGRALWLRGLAQAQQWRLSDALTAYRLAAECFESAAERENAVGVYSQTADALKTLGEHQESWQYIGRMLLGLSSVRTPVRRYLFLYNASLFAANEDLLEAALLFQDGAVREAELRGGMTTLTDALTERAALLARRGDYDAAARELARVGERIRATPAGPLKEYNAAEFERVSADLNWRRGVPMRTDGVQRALAFFTRARPAMVPGLYLATARARLSSGDVSAAVAALDDGIAALESRQSRLADEAFRISYFDDAWSLFPDMVDLQLRERHDEDRAFAYAERARGRALLGGAAPLRISDVQRQLADGAAMLYYVTLDDRLVIWTITRDAHRLVVEAVGGPALRRLVGRYRTALGRSTAESVNLADTLYDTLVRPAASALAGKSRLIVVGDATLQQVPFATLHDRLTGRYALEEYEIVQAPSATYFAARRMPSGIDERRPASALLVGNPQVDLAPLPGSEAEVAAAAQRYPVHDVLVGAAATKRRFVEEAPRYDVVHFGGHAFANLEYPLLSRLSFASDRVAGTSDPLFAYEISRMRFTRTRLVVLAACSTGVGAVSRSEGVMSLARPFLAAGVPLVVASQWDVDDRATEQLFVAFHRYLTASWEPAAALRSAQLGMLHSGRMELAAPAQWGAFVAVGTIGHP